MSNDVSVTIDVANQSITSSNTNIITVPTQNFEIVTFDNKPCIRATNSYYATFTLNPTIKSLSCDVFLQAVDGFTLFIEFDTVLNTKYSLVYYPYGTWWNPDSAVFDRNNVLVGVWVTVTYSSTDRTITFDNGTTRLVRLVDSSIADLTICNFGSRYNIYLTNLGAETSSRYVNGSGVSEMWANTKNYIASQLLGKSNVGHTHSASDITSGLATVATSGSYNDLSNKPTIPTVNNATLTIQKNGTNVQTFTANQSTNATANITVPTKTSDLTNDSGFITSDNTKIPLAGSNQISGSLIPATTNAYDLGGSSYQWNNAYIKSLTINGAQFLPSNYIPKAGGSVVTGTGIGRVDNTRGLDICGGTNFENGGFVALRGKDTNVTGQKGAVVIGTNDGSSNCDLMLYPNGTATWGSKNVAMQEDVVPRSGGAVMTGLRLGRNIDYSVFQISGASADEKGSYIRLHGKDYGDIPFAGSVFINANAGSTAKQMFLFPNGTWTWTGTACQITSDQRLKQQIAEIDDKLLDAWEDVDLVQFKYNDAVDQKGNNARLHTGYVVQQIDEACQKHDVDISNYGLYCHEEYPEETEEVEVEQADGTKAKERKVIREANEHYSLRYTEALIVECAYLRKCIKELRTEIEELKSSK